MSDFAQILSQRAHPLRLPEASTDDIQRHVQQHQQSSTPERSPFRLQLNFWVFSIVTALAKNISPLEGPSSKWGRRFADTRSVTMPDDVCNLLAVVAFHHLGSDHEDIDSPQHIIEIGNLFAGAGCPIVLDRLMDSDFRVTALRKMLSFAAELHHAATARDKDAVRDTAGGDHPNSLDH